MTGEGDMAISAESTRLDADLLTAAEVELLLKACSAKCKRASKTTAPGGRVTWEEET